VRISSDRCPATKRGIPLVVANWVELVPLRKATTATLIRAFRERIISHFGAARKLVCDNGSQFTSKAFKDFLKETGVEPKFTAPYCPRENPTERENRTVKTMIAQNVENGQNTWDSLLPELSLALNTSVPKSTGYSPAFLLQAREPRLPGSWYDSVTPGTATSPQSPSERADRLKEVFQIAPTYKKLAENRGDIITCVVEPGSPKCVHWSSCGNTICLKQ